MGLIWRRTKRLDAVTDLNVSGRGASLSRRVGRRLRFNSPGGGSFRIRSGMSWRFGRRR
jgi:hypothetical protein